jgi:penicillin-insensitive murein endopeptidase
LVKLFFRPAFAAAGPAPGGENLREAGARSSLEAMTRGFASLVAACALALGCRSSEGAARPDQQIAAVAQAEVPEDRAAENSLEAEAIVEEAVPGGGPDPLLLTAAVSASIGGPNAGSLAGGVPLPLHGPGYRFSPNKQLSSRYGTVELVQALVKAAAVVHETMPGNELTIGDLGKEMGGDISGHASHRSGRDVDVYFYLLREDGSPFAAKAIPLDTEGKGTDYLDLSDPSDDVAVQIDLPRTWRFVQALLEQDEVVLVQRIFVVEHLRSMLLKEAQRQNAPKSIRQLFADVTCQPAAPHDDHLHIRVFCSSDDIGEGCEDGPPIYPWHKARLAQQGTVAVAAKPAKPGKVKKGRTSRAQAKADAGPMHHEVRDFLDRREAWAKKPHPGRQWCK